MRDLDSRAQALMSGIDDTASYFLYNIKNFSPEKRKSEMEKIQDLFNKAKEYGDDKVQLAIQTYERVSKGFLNEAHCFISIVLIKSFA